jgi:hypothetical protein
MTVMLAPDLEDVIDRLRDEGARLFGRRDVQLTPIHAADREASKVLKVAVSGVEGVDTVFVKVFKPLAPGPGARDEIRARVVRDFNVTTAVHASMATLPRYGTARPLACFPEQLAVVTAEAPGETLLQLLERRAAWWPSSHALGEVKDAVTDVGRWVRAFQSVQSRPGAFSLDEMREYIDVRLRRLLVARIPVFDGEGRNRVLRDFDRIAATVDPGDLRQVLTHGDLAPSNVLVTRHGITVIDFAMVTPGGLFMDIARLYTQLEFLMAKPKFRPAVIRELQHRLLGGFDLQLQPERPLFRLFLLQHLLCHMSNLARNPAPPFARLYNRHQLRLHQQWLQTFAA